MSLFSSTRRGFFGGLIGGVGALQGLLTGATPPVVPTVKLRPIDPKQAKLFEFLERMFHERKEFFLQGDIGGFTQSVGCRYDRDEIDITSIGETTKRYFLADDRMDVDLAMHLECEHGYFGQFQLESTISSRSKAKMNLFVNHRINPDDLPSRSCMLPLGADMRDALVFEDSRFYVSRMTFSTEP